jgi:hypothetical protein
MIMNAYGYVKKKSFCFETTAGLMKWKQNTNEKSPLGVYLLVTNEKKRRADREEFFLLLSRFENNEEL